MEKTEGLGHKTADHPMDFNESMGSTDAKIS